MASLSRAKSAKIVCKQELGLEMIDTFSLHHDLFQVVLHD